MPIIVFACKSNSCRSQMAEGWARDWLEQEKMEAGEKLKASNALDERNVMRRRLGTLDETIVASVALDSNAVFTSSYSVAGTGTGVSASADSGNKETKTDFTANSNLQRKSIKSKAITAMAEEGIDISKHIPKTIGEVLPLLYYGAKCEGFETDVIVDGIGSSTSTTNVNNINSGIPEIECKPVDKLIVLCSCGDELKKKLIGRSKSVEEWSIDAPTTAAKAGEGDAAYRRVSLEIKDEVDILMESVLGNLAVM